jgi:lactate dehydrogenase-like 2-hydroxyacid dehydrogenase
VSAPGKIQGLINESALATFPPESVVMNVARGRVVDQAALAAYSAEAVRGGDTQRDRPEASAAEGSTLEG